MNYQLTNYGLEYNFNKFINPSVTLDEIKEFFEKYDDEYGLPSNGKIIINKVHPQDLISFKKALNKGLFKEAKLMFAFETQIHIATNYEFAEFELEVNNAYYKLKLIVN
jgi:hypothetical protein